MTTFNENPTQPQSIPVAVENQPKSTATAPLAGRRIVSNIPATGQIPSAPTPIRSVGGRRK